MERKTRKEIIKRIPNNDALSVVSALGDIFAHYQQEETPVFKSITAESDSEFSSLAVIGEQHETDIYFANPYASYEHGTNARYNGLIRRFIKKGQPIHSYTDE